MLIRFFFFFSSRRRHTRSLRDWSSDVCSSDLDASGYRCWWLTACGAMAGVTCWRFCAVRERVRPTGKANRGSLRVDEDGRDAAPTTTSRVRASGLGVHFGGCDVQLSAHADTDAEVCLKSAQRPELHVSWRNQNKYQTRTDRRISHEES